MPVGVRAAVTEQITLSTVETCKPHNSVRCILEFTLITYSRVTGEECAHPHTHAQVSRRDAVGGDALCGPGAGLASERPLLLETIDKMTIAGSSAEEKTKRDANLNIHWNTCEQQQQQQQQTAQLPTLSRCM